MGALMAVLALGGLGGLGLWLAKRDDVSPPEPGSGAAPLALPPPADEGPARVDEAPPQAWPPPPSAPPPAWPPPPSAPAPRPPRSPVPRVPRVPQLAGPAPSGAPTPPRPATPALAPSDFVRRLRAWLEQGPEPTQLELMAVQLEQAGHRETASQLRALARDRRARATAAPAVTPGVDGSGPPAPTSPQPAPGGSSDSSPERGSERSPSTADGSGAPTAPSPPPSGDGTPTEPELRELARRVAAMLTSRQGQGTDRALVRRFQVAAGLFPQHGSNPSGLYGPVTRDALARSGVRNPPRPRFRAAVEAAAPRPSNGPAGAPGASGAPSPSERPARPGRPARPAAPRPNRTPSPPPPAAR